MNIAKTAALDLRFFSAQRLLTLTLKWALS